MTIRKKLTLLYSGLLAGFIVIFGVVIFGVIRSAWIETVDSALWETTEQVIANSRAYQVREFGSVSSIRIALPELNIFRASGVGVQVWSDVNGTEPTLAGSSANLSNYRRPLDADTLGTFASIYTTVPMNDMELRVLTRTVTLPGGTRPLWNVQAAASLQTINEATEKLSFFMLIVGTMAVIGSLGMGLLLTDQALRPLEGIIHAADGIATAQDLKTRLAWSGPKDELGRLTSVFNHMMNRLEHLFGVQQRFVADVSHELRTPLTTIRGNLDLARRYGMDAASLEAITSETDRMTRMVDDLLLLARADYGGLTIERSELDLDTVLAEVYQQARVLTKDRTLQVQLETIEPIRILGNADRMKQLLLNLVSNAIKFTPDGGEIRLRLQRVGGAAQLQVADTGIGIPPEHLTRIFDRFYQVEESRARLSSDAGGTGLGLSIAKWIVEAHGGTIEVESQVDQGTTFTIKLPALPPCCLADDSPHHAAYQANNGHGRSRLSALSRWRRAAPEPEAERES